MNDSLNHGFSLPPEQQAILDKSFHPSGTFVGFPIEDVETSIPARFEKIVQRYPHRIAVKSKTEQLTYAELNLAANRIAQAILARCGESPEPIGLLFPKGVAFVTAMLANLKAGKICVPLDPALPPAQLSLMFQDLQARFLVTDQAGLALANSLAGHNRCLNIDELGNYSNEKCSSLPLSPDTLAIIFYTSGSTGQPKGVTENHRNLLYHTMKDTNHFHICADDRLTFVASSGRDVLRALLNGAVVHPIDIRQEGFAGLGRRLMEEKITIFNCVASAFRNFVGTLTSHERFPCLRLIKVTGETLHKSDFELYQKHFSDNCIFVNRYGPNEAGHSSQYLMDKATVISSHIVPVGYTDKGKVIQLVDESGNPVSFGQPGEIVVTSRHLSPGYWRQPERTHAVFRVNSLNDQVRVYYTGDMGTMSSDGCLTYLGRKDFQVKIRGNKVEMAAIETALLNLETVREAAVIAVEDDAGDKRLVAYVVARNVPGPTANQLRTALAASLAEYMVPSTFVFLDKLPVIGIGKIDRRALPAADKRRPKLDTPFVASRTPVEQQLTSIWAEVLGLDQIGIHDNFFDLGGHSLAAMRVVSQVIKQFQLEIPLQSLFHSPTVAEMAAVITEHQGKQLGEKELERMLSEIEMMSDEEANKRLVQESTRS
jgi:amino acid adenylation domain-containing protein